MSERFREWRWKSVNPATVNISLSHLRSAFQWAEDHRYTEKNPFAVKNLKIRIDKKIPLALTPAEIDAFFGAVEPQHKPLFFFVLSTGARRAEIANLQWEDVDFANKTITFRKTKGKKDRAIPITVELAHMPNAIPDDLREAAEVLSRRAQIVG